MGAVRSVRGLLSAGMTVLVLTGAALAGTSQGAGEALRQVRSAVMGEATEHREAAFESDGSDDVPPRFGRAAEHSQAGGNRDNEHSQAGGNRDNEHSRAGGRSAGAPARGRAARD